MARISYQYNDVDSTNLIVSLDQLKLQLTIDSDFTDDDLLLSSYLLAAQNWVENYCHRSLTNRSATAYYDGFPLGYWGGTIQASERYYLSTKYWRRLSFILPIPASAITSIIYIDCGGTQFTVDPSTYNAQTTSEPAIVCPAYNCSWPTATTYMPGSVQIDFTTKCFATVPAAIEQAILLLASNWYANREASSPLGTKSLQFGVESLLDPYVFDCNYLGEL